MCLKETNSGTDQTAIIEAPTAQVTNTALDSPGRPRAQQDDGGPRTHQQAGSPEWATGSARALRFWHLQSDGTRRDDGLAV